MPTSLVKRLACSLIALLFALSLALLPGCQGLEEKGTQEHSQGQSQELVQQSYHFRTTRLLNSHYDKHGEEMGFSSPQEYEQAASRVATNPQALHKLEKEDGDDVYYLEDSNELVIVSTDGYIRTYFKPNGGKSYFLNQ